VAGFREFVTGEVLTAANVNGFLMEQAVMTFADDAARTAALAGVLREGLLTYNLDTGALERYDGTAWVPAAPDVPGIGSNVVYASGGTGFTTTAGTFVNDTGLTLDITPTTNTSRILLLWAARVDHQASTGAITIRGRRTIGGTTTAFGADAGSDLRVTGGLSTITFIGVDTPGTTSAVTYGVQISATNGRILTRNMVAIEVAA
jgi:hypothetical protein